MTFSFAKPVNHPQLAGVKRLTYIVGEPGVGKSTLAAHLLRGLPSAERDRPFAYRLYTCGVYELGKRRPDFPGTDALSMAVQPDVVRWLEGSAPFMVFGEGDRLGTTSFLNSAEALGYDVRVWFLAGAEVAASQRRMRATAQDEAWVTSRRTKVANLVADRLNSGRFVQTLTAGAHPSVLEAQMAESDPLVRALVAARTKR